MAVPISYDQLEEINTGYLNLLFVAILLFPVFSIPLLLFCSVCFIFSTKCCRNCLSQHHYCNCWETVCCNVITAIAKWTFCFLKTKSDYERQKDTDSDVESASTRNYSTVYVVSENDRNVEVFVICDHKAPLCYTIYLFYIAIVLLLHCFLVFFVNAVVEPVADCEFIINSTSTDYCFEIDLLSGLESFGTVFGFSAIAMAGNTYMLLTCCACRCSKDNKNYKKYNRGFTCCRFICLLPFHLTGLFAPRIFIYYYYFSYFFRNQSVLPIADHILRNQGPLEVKSFLILAAVMDAFSLTCLTPWCCFTRKDKKNKAKGKCCSHFSFC